MNDLINTLSSLQETINTLQDTIKDFHEYVYIPKLTSHKINLTNTESTYILSWPFYEGIYQEKNLKQLNTIAINGIPENITILNTKAQSNPKTISFLESIEEWCFNKTLDLKYQEPPQDIPFLALKKAVRDFYQVQDKLLTQYNEQEKILPFIANDFIQLRLEPIEAENRVPIYLKDTFNNWYSDNTYDNTLQNIITEFCHNEPKEIFKVIQIFENGSKLAINKKPKPYPKTTNYQEEIEQRATLAKVMRI